ncbi:MAG TPA: tetratricopeptide repeat protein [Methanobacteriaceae archaeon]|nr:tetratricopeptide repeat protein [Methanobacteriaceae archaeon]
MEGEEAYQLGMQLREEGNPKESLQYYRQALQEFKKDQNYRKEADTYLELANSYSDLGNRVQAVRYYQSALDIYSELEDSIGEGYALTGLGVINERIEDYDEARTCYGKAMQCFKRARDYERQEILLTLMAGTYQSDSNLHEVFGEQSPKPDVYAEVTVDENEGYLHQVTGMVERKRSELSSSRKYALQLMGYLVALIVAELLTTYVNKFWGVSAHLVILGVLLVHSSLVESVWYSNLLRSLIAVPIIRVIGMSMPIIQLQPFFWFPIVAIPLFAASIVIMRSQGLSLKDVGLTLENLPFQLLIGITGVFLGIIEYSILKPDPLIPVFTPLTFLVAFFVLLISTGLAEELLFRGIIQGNAQMVFSPVFAILFTALVFTTMHIGWQSATDLLFVFSVALIYGFIFYKTKNIVGVTLNHGLSNTVLFIVMPFYNLLAFLPFK